MVEEAKKVASYGSLLKVCKDLLHEKIPIVDMLTIIEAIADIARDLQKLQRYSWSM